MSGKGTYIWDNGIIYEGDFLNNEIVGTGKYLWPSKQHKYSTYEGEVLKGKRHGLGTFRSGQTAIVYIGEWVTGKRYGKGKMVYDAEGVSYYEGDWIDNKMFGWGVRRYPSGNIYEGMWVNDVRHGEGTMRWFDKSQTYSGQWENGVQVSQSMLMLWFVLMLFFYFEINRMEPVSIIGTWEEWKSRSIR